MLKQIYIETIVCAFGLVCLVIPVTNWLFRLQKEIKLAKKNPSGYMGIVIVENVGRRSIKNSVEYIYVVNLNSLIPTMIFRIYLYTYLWGLHMFVLGMCINLNFLYILVEIGFTNLAFVFVFRALISFVYSKSISDFSWKLPGIMLIPGIFELIKLVQIPGVTVIDVIYEVSILILLFLIYHSSIFLIGDMINKKYEDK